MRKKGLVMIGFTVFIFVLMLIASWYLALSSGTLGNVVTIGRDQLQLVKSYQEAEETLLYLDMAAQEAAADTLYELAKNGMETDKKRNYAGYTIWYDGASESFPEFKDTDLTERFNDNLDGYIEDTHYLPKSNYDIQYHQEGDYLIITGSPKKPLEIPLTTFGYGVDLSQKKNLAATTRSPEGYDLIQSPNYYHRYNRKITDIIIFGSGDRTFEETKSRYLDEKSKQSAHYVIARNGSITQMVLERDMAWGGQKDDDMTISISLVNLLSRCAVSATCKASSCCKTCTGGCFEEYDPMQIKALISLIKDIKKRNKIVDIKSGPDNPALDLDAIKTLTK